MGSRNRFFKVASLGGILALGSTLAWAQAGQSDWTVDKVLTTDPFGTIDIDEAGTSPETVLAWTEKRSDSERAELMGRCGVIGNPMYAPRYSDFARDFCRHYMESAGNLSATAQR